MTREGLPSRIVKIENMAELEELLKQKENICLYGAGFIARCFIKKVEHMGKKHPIISAIYVTSKRENPNMLCGISVCELRKEAAKSFILVAAMEKLQYSICEKLHSIGCEDVLLLSDNCCNCLEYDYYKDMDERVYPRELEEWYRRHTGEKLDLVCPVTFNEKIQWIKLHGMTPLITRLADKYRVRKWVEEKIGEKPLIPLLGVWNKFEDIEIDKLPDQFVLKCNHGSGWNEIVTDKANWDVGQAAKKFNKWMNTNFAFVAGLELQYRDIEPKIIAEEYIKNIHGNFYDYRFFCFNGEPKFIWVDVGSGTDMHKRNIYDMDWNIQDYQVNYPNIGIEVEKPDNFSQMIDFVLKMCKEFIFVRIDLYNVNGKIYFGEMTFTPQSGIGRFPKPQAIEYGELLQLPI